MVGCVFDICLTSARRSSAMDLAYGQNVRFATSYRISERRTILPFPDVL